MKKKITIEKKNRGWLLTIEEDGYSTEENCYEIPSNLMMGIATALSGGSSQIDTENKEEMTIKLSRKFL